jgi:outer membrane protein TolC
MVRFILLLTLFLSFSTTGGAQEITLDSCIQSAYRTYALVQQAELNQQITEANKNRFGRNYLPSLELNAMATYQNEQITIPVDIPIPGFEAPAAPLNLNSALFTLRQWIYDGSQTNYQKLLEDANGRVKSGEIAVQQLEVKTAVMQQYFAALLKSKQLEIITDKESVLDIRLEETKAAVENNLLLLADFNNLKAERVILKQRKAELTYSLQENLRALQQLTQLKIDNNATLVVPEAIMSSRTDASMRPDVQLLNNQISILEAQKALTKSAYLPRIGVFADGGLGLPGYNIFDDAIAPMGRVGISFNWRIFDWNKGSLQRQSLSLNQQLLLIKQQQVLTQVGVKTEGQLNAMAKARALMQDDAELVELYTQVADAYAAQLENGTLTAAEYIIQLNKAEEARINLELHRMQLLIAILNYNTLLGE